MKRRDFVAKLIALGLLPNTNLLSSCAEKRDGLKILILGGTNFVGPALVAAAMQNGHDVTLFNRGITNPDLFPELKLIKGDREAGTTAYDPLKREKWDVVIDVWPDKSALVEEAVSALADHADHYVFISSIAVYNNFQEVGLNELSQVVSLEPPRQEWYYGEEKLAAENVVKDQFPGQHTILRPGPIKGWRDPALDLLYWCIKIDRGDDIIAPGSGLDPLQFIDVNDVGRFAIGAVENKYTGVFNCTGPTNKALLWKDFLELARKHFNSQSTLHWADEAFLKEHKVMSFSDLPLWAPLSEDRGFMQISANKLIETGFAFTPIEKTLDDSMHWYRTSKKENIKFGTEGVDLGLERSRELELITSLTG